MIYDVAIVGAGPAGSTTAKFLAEKGLKTVLIDKSKFPRDKPCAGGLPSRVLRRFPYIKENDLIESYSYGGLALSPSLKYKAMIKKEDPIVGMVLRKKFDTGLVQLAVKKGAKLIDGKAVEDIIITKEKVKIKLDDDTPLESKIIVGADGVWSIVAKKTGLMTLNRPHGICAFNEYEIDEDKIENLFGKERMCYLHLAFNGIFGYGWVFPKKQHINIGIGMLIPKKYVKESKKNILDVYKDYFNILKENKVLPENLEIGKCRGGALPFFPLDKTFSDRVLIVGDAAGFINPLTGEGIYYAMTSGEIAAKVINESLEANDTGENYLSKYQDLWKEDFGKDLKILLGITKYMKSSSEYVVRCASKDKKLADISLGVIHGGLSISKYQGKLLRRYAWVNFKERLRII
jgi:geranylgeranyl reductase family protein